MRTEITPSSFYGTQPGIRLQSVHMILSKKYDTSRSTRLLGVLTPILRLLGPEGGDIGRLLVQFWSVLAVLWVDFGPVSAQNCPKPCPILGQIPTKGRSVPPNVLPVASRPSSVPRKVLPVADRPIREELAFDAFHFTHKEFVSRSRCETK